MNADTERLSHNAGDTADHIQSVTVRQLYCKYQ